MATWLNSSLADGIYYYKHDLDIDLVIFNSKLSWS